MSNSSILYLRSATESDSRMIEQESKLKKFAKEQGYTVSATFSDNGKSGTNIKGRDGLIEALHYIQIHPEVSALIVQDTSHLARNEFDYYQIHHKLRTNDVKLVSMHQPKIEDSPEARLMNTLMAACNEIQSQLTGRKVKEVHRQMAIQGRVAHKAPIGYLNVNEGTGEEPKRVVEVDPKNAPLVRKIFELYASGLSMSEIVRRLRMQKEVPHRSSSIAHILSNPFYIGKIKYCGETYQGQHEPLVSAELFNKCQELRHMQSRRKETVSTNARSSRQKAL